MSAEQNAKHRTLLNEIEHTECVLERLIEFYKGYTGNDDFQHRGIEQAIVISDTLEKYYTGLETIYLRVSRHFENHLASERWHSDLLQKMIIDIDGIRPAVVSEQAYPLLVELMKFRHFRRYYFDLDYDWDRLDFLHKKFVQSVPLVAEDLHRFKEFMRELIRQDYQ